MIRKVLLFIILSQGWIKSQAERCFTNAECEKIWPGSTCRRSRCRCPHNYVQRKSPSRKWVCLAVIDAATGQIAPPLTCPLPDGAGYQVVLRNSSLDRVKPPPPVFCSTKTNDCKDGYECIKGLSIFGEIDGVCCPDQTTTCAQPIFDGESDTLNRWGFNGSKCVEFRWNPEKPSSANNFKTKMLCESYCINIT